MVCALISDVHGNFEALVAVMEDIQSDGTIDETLFLGDAVGYGANPNEVVRMIKTSCTARIMGNHDYTALGLFDTEEFNEFARDAMDYTATVLTEESVGVISTFKMQQQLGEMHLVHSTPKLPENWDYCLSAREAERQMPFIIGQVCFVGHSHRPAIYQQDPAGTIRDLRVGDQHLDPGSKYLINIGSVGQPRDGDPRSCYAVYDGIAGSLRFRRVAYDVKTAQSKMKRAKLPDFLIERLAVGK